MSLRLILQPTMVRHPGGTAGCANGSPAYFWAVLTDPTQRTDLLHEGWKAVAKVLVMAVLIDVIYQFIELRWFYPLEALIVALRWPSFRTC
jgi:hypothetical protein